jgi:hypothetical protein
VPDSRPEVTEDKASPRRAESSAPRARTTAHAARPRRRQLAELARLTSDERLFTPHPEGHRLIGERQHLAAALGISRQSLWGRLQRLLRAGLVAEIGRDLVVHTDRIQQLVAPTVVAIPTEATRQFHAAMATAYTPAAAADGTVAYLRADGTPATLREMSDHMGWESPSTARHHLRRPPEAVAEPGASIGDVASPALTAVSRALEAATDLLVVARHSGDDILVAAATRFADELMRYAGDRLSSGRDVNLDARSKPRRDDASRDGNRDIPAAMSRLVPDSGSGLDGNSIHPVHTAEQRDDERGPNADTAGPPSGSPLWDAAEFPTMLRPLELAWYRRYQKRLTPLNTITVARAQQRPRDEVAQAISILANQVDAGVEIRDASAVLGAAIRDGNPEYFNVADDPSPGLAEQHRADTVARIAADVRRASSDLYVAAHLLVAGAGDDDQLLIDSVRATRSEIGDAQQFVASVLAQVDHTRAAVLQRHLDAEDRP